MLAFPIKLNLWKDVGNTIFPHGTQRKPPLKTAINSTMKATVSAGYGTLNYFAVSLKNGGELLPPWNYITTALPVIGAVNYAVNA